MTRNLRLLNEAPGKYTSIQSNLKKMNG